MAKKNEWQSIADDIEIEVKSETENQIKERKINKENKDTEKDDKAEYTWDKI